MPPTPKIPTRASSSLRITLVIPIRPEAELDWLVDTIERHRRLTGSTVDVDPRSLIKVMPRDYRRVLQTIEQARDAGLDADGIAAAIMEGVK